MPVRHTLDAAVYLGALCDADLRPRQWLEVWIQSVGMHGGRKLEGMHTNASLDQRWKRWAGALLEEDPEAVHSGPWQEAHPKPLYYAPSEKAMVHPQLPGDGLTWQLCTDDLVLRKAGLPAFSSTLQRILHAVAPGETHFCAADPQATPGPRLKAPDAAMGFGAGWVPVNPEGGLMLFRTFETYTLRQFKAVLEGHRLDAVNLDADGFLHPEVAPILRTTGYVENRHGFLFSGRRGQHGRALEVFLLKTILFQEVVTSVSRCCAAAGVPFLSLHSSDFRVDMAGRSDRFPAFWSFRTALTRSPDSLPVEIAAGGYRLFQPSAPVQGSEYRPKQLSSGYKGYGTVRLREARDEGADTVILEGTLADIETRRAQRNDLLRLVLPVRGQGMGIHARILSDQQMASDELRFASLPIPVRTDLREALRAVCGAPLESVPFEFQPVASSPCDLYSCAVLGLEILLDPGRVRLALAVDEFLSLVRQVGLEDAKLPLSVRRDRVLAAEPRFLKSLGPQNLLMGSGGGGDEDRPLIPAALWWAYIDAVIRMIPGGVPDGWSRDLGDVNPSTLDACFRGAQEELSGLAEAIRSVLFSDWAQNQEVIQILDQIGV